MTILEFRLLRAVERATDARVRDDVTSEEIARFYPWDRRPSARTVGALLAALRRRGLVVRVKGRRWMLTSKGLEVLNA